MKRLILMRHAKTEPWYQGSDDEGRALLPRGKSDATLVAAELKRRGWLPDTVLISSARRTRETWMAMGNDVPDAKHHVLEALYLAGTNVLEATTRAHEDSKTVMILGHNPGIHDFAISISARAGSINQKAALTLADKMPTAAAALFEIDQDGSFDIDHLRLQDFIIAKKLRPEDDDA